MEQFLLYILIGLGFIPFGLMYAALRIHNQNAWYVLVLPMVGGVLTGLIIRSVAQRRRTTGATDGLRHRPQSAVASR